MTERLKDLFIEFDEMGFSPTIPCENLEKAAIEWKEKVIKEIEALISEIDEANEIARHYEAKTWEYTEIICDEKSETAQAKHRAEVAETAKEILQELYNRLELVSEDGLHTMMVCNTHLFDLAKQFNIELEEEV